MMRFVLAGFVLFLGAFFGFFTTGCATPEVKIPAGTAAVMYAHASGDYAMAKYAITMKCRQGILDKNFCDQANAIDQRVTVYAKTIEDSLMNPSQPVDWVKVIAYTQDVAQLLVALGVIGVK